MTCTTTYADVIDFLSLWCLETVLGGADNSGGAGNPSLYDGHGLFWEKGVRPNRGFRAYNVTQGTYGLITAVADNYNLTATGVTWDDGDVYQVPLVDGQEISAIELALNQFSTDIHAARAASGGCDCTLASWAADYLARLNAIGAASYMTCPCAQPAISDELKKTYLEQVVRQLRDIRESKIELCDGHTGSDFPAIGHADHGWTPWNTARIIYKEESLT